MVLVQKITNALAISAVFSELNSFGYFLNWFLQNLTQYVINKITNQKMICVRCPIGLFLSNQNFLNMGIKTMKMNLARLQVFAPLYMAANTEQKKALLEEYKITKATFYNAVKRYQMTISTTKTLH